MIDKLTRQQLKSLIQDNRWQAVEIYLVEFLTRANEMPVKGDTEFNTIWNLAHKEGIVNGIKLFFRELEENAND